jgi:Ankyrin repeats (3 copies)
MGNKRWYEKGLLQEAVDSALSGDMQKIKEVVEMKISLDLEIENGYTPLETAAHDGSIHLVKFLLESGADPKIRWPLDVAASRGHQEIYDLLFDLVGEESQIEASKELPIGLFHRARANSDPDYAWDEEPPTEM